MATRSMARTTFPLTSGSGGNCRSGGVGKKEKGGGGRVGENWGHSKSKRRHTNFDEIAFPKTDSKLRLMATGKQKGKGGGGRGQVS